MQLSTSPLPVHCFDLWPAWGVLDLETRIEETAQDEEAGLSLLLRPNSQSCFLLNIQYCSVPKVPPS